MIKESLVLGWSPEIISHRLKLERELHEQLCHSTIYRRIEEIGNTVVNCIVTFRDLEKVAGKVVNARKKPGWESYLTELISVNAPR